MALLRRLEVAVLLSQQLPVLLHLLRLLRLLPAVLLPRLMAPAVAHLASRALVSQTASAALSTASAVRRLTTVERAAIRCLETALVLLGPRHLRALLLPQRLLLPPHLLP